MFYDGNWYPYSLCELYKYRYSPSSWAGIILLMIDFMEIMAGPCKQFTSAPEIDFSLQ